MGYKIVLDSFEGPLDLLLSLIEKQKIDIYDIPINVITEQYLDYIEQMEILNLEVTSDFLLMAATLLQIKSKMLLPKVKVEAEEEEEEDPREELVRRLLAYKKFKEAEAKLRNYEEIGLQSFTKPQEDLTQFEEEEVDLGPLDVESLFMTLNRILNKRGLAVEDFDLGAIRRDEYSVKDCTENILRRLEDSRTIKFSQLLRADSSKNEIVAYFLSVLELMKAKTILVEQEYAFADLIIRKNEIGANY